MTSQRQINLFCLGIGMALGRLLTGLPHWMPDDSTTATPDVSITRFERSNPVDESRNSQFLQDSCTVSRSLDGSPLEKDPPGHFEKRLVKPATEATRKLQQAAAAQLNLADRKDFDDAFRGLIAPIPNDGEIRDATGRVVWRLADRVVAKLDEPSPQTVNPSLWRQAQLLGISGLFKVADRIYQVRGLDLANITFIEGDTGLIVIDPLLSEETAAAALELYYQHRPRVPVHGIIITHSHPDHFGGAGGIVSHEQGRLGNVIIVAPESFMEEVVSESILAGNVMQRRAGYMYGGLLPKDAMGDIGNGLGLGTSTGTMSLLKPTDLIRKTGDVRVIDRLTFEFQLTPGSEAPAEMHFYIRELKALCPAENATHTMHNLYTLRGAKIRDARAWAAYLQQTIELFGERVDVLFAPHHWPVWGQQDVVSHLAHQRDLYKFIHDQTLRLANRGYNMVECAEQIKLPPEMESYWSNRGHYGSLNHNVKAVWNYYLGWFDGHPARLHPLPPKEAGTNYVEFMGGVDEVLQKARRSFERGDYRWTAQVVDHVVSVEPENRAARELLADALEQLGYQAECGPWRNFYLTGAQELRHGIQPRQVPIAETSGSVAAVPLSAVFDSMAVRLNSDQASSDELSVNFQFTDTHERYALRLKNRVLNCLIDQQITDADCTICTTRLAFNEILEQRSSFVRQVLSGTTQIRGSPRKLQLLFRPVEPFEPWFEVMTRRSPDDHVPEL